jgi:hypothetical protein
MKPSTEVRDAVIRLYECMGTGDVDAVKRLVSCDGDALVIGSNPGEWWEGLDTIAEAFKEQLQASGTRRIKPGDLHAFVEGTVGWAADRRTMRLANGRELTIRETFLFHREDGEWKLVQFHASVVVPNVELAG